LYEKVHELVRIKLDLFVSVLFDIGKFRNMNKFFQENACIVSVMHVSIICIDYTLLWVNVKLFLPCHLGT